MEAVVAETMKSFQSDFFNYDKPRIESADFKFPAIWIVGELHTHFLELGNFKDKFFEFESIRYAYIRNNNLWEYYLTETFFAKDKWFLVTESGLQPISREQAKAAMLDYIVPAVHAWESENGPLQMPSRVSIRFKNITIGKLKALITECRAHGDDSLLDCLKQRQNSCRVAADQYVEINYFEHWKKFDFCEYVNGSPSLSGGIIFHGWPETGYETNGSVQIDPHYGWSSHT